MISLRSSGAGLTSFQTTGLFELSVVDFDTPAYFNQTRNLFPCWVSHICSKVIRATVCGLKPKYLNPPIPSKIQSYPFLRYFNFSQLFSSINYSVFSQPYNPRPS